jgi:succinate dehydrogenase/fumarate reductase flavoprotein subunit
VTNNWDDEVDVAIVGFGAAGAAAAITASKHGASVLLAEKQAQNRHTPSSKMSRGVIMTVKDTQQGFDYLAACAGGMIPERPLSALSERANVILSWMREVCPDLPFTIHGGAEHPTLPGAAGIETYQPGRARFRRDPAALTGRDVFDALAGAVAQTSTRVLWQCPAQRLLRDEHDTVSGVLLKTPQGDRRVRAHRGVILTCGGFEYDDAMKLNYLRAYPVYFYGNPGSTGDGVRMAQEVGADLWHMNQIVGRGIGNFRLDDGVEMGFQLSIDSKTMGYNNDPVGYVIVDRFGNRFANEQAQALMKHNFYYDLLHFDSDRGIYPRIPCYWLFDERRRRASPLTSPRVGAPAVGLYDWSADNFREIERGWIVRGDSILEVAEKIGIEDPQAAARAVEIHNAACKGGSGDAFGRPTETLVPLDEPPFYGVKMWPGGPNTAGGPRRDEFSRVLNAFGEPIKGLFAAGELGQVSGLLYPCDGFALCEALCFGQIAAEAAVEHRNSAGSTS